MNRIKSYHVFICNWSHITALLEFFLCNPNKRNLSNCTDCNCKLAWMHCTVTLIIVRIVNNVTNVLNRFLAYFCVYWKIRYFVRDSTIMKGLNELVVTWPIVNSWKEYDDKSMDGVERMNVIQIHDMITFYKT